MWRAEDWPWCKDPAHVAGPMWMDDVHVEVIYRICMEVGFRSVLEIGAFDGFSTSAVVQAKIDTKVGLLTVIDRTVRPGLIKTLGKSRDGWGVYQGCSWELIGHMPLCDLVILDSDHDLTTTEREWDALQEQSFKTIIAHDCGAKCGCPGPQWLLAQLVADPDWFVLVDELQREGVWTHRGLMLATTDRKVFEQASRVWPDGRVPERAAV